MRILFISQHYYPDMVSTGLHMTELSSKMLDLEKDNLISVFCADSARKEFTEKKRAVDSYKGITIHRTSNVGKLHGGLLSRFIFGLSFLLKTCFFLVKNRKEFDVILLTTNPPFLGIASWFFNKISGVPYILIVYDIYPQIVVQLGILKAKNPLVKIWKKINEHVYNNAQNIVSIGEDMTRIIISSLKIKDISRITLIHNWSDKNIIYPIEKKNNRFIKRYELGNKRILLYSGTMGRTHNIECILEAAIKLNDEKDIVFIFIGGGNKRKLIEDHIQSKQSDNVMLLPFQPIEELAHTQSAADLSFVCLESEFTGLSVPSKAYGIMAAGVPMIGLLDESSEIAITITRHHCGKVWNERSKEPLDILLKKTLENTSELAEMKANAYSAFKENFDLEISAKKYNNLLKAI